MSTFTELVLSSPTRQVMPVATFPGAKLLGRTIVEMARDPRIQAEVSATLRDRLGLSFSQSAMDLSVESEAFGASVRMVDDEVPTVTGRLVRDAAGIAALRVPQVGAGRTGVYLETVRILAREPDPRFVLGGCIGPFTLAGRLFGVSESLEFAIEESEAMEDLIAKATEFLIDYVHAFRDAGAQALFMAEPTAGLLSPKMLARFSSRYVRRIVEACEDGRFSIILHNCGARLAHLPAILESGATAFHFGQPMDLAAAARQVPAQVVVCGNLDPSGVFVGLSPDEISARTAALGQSIAGLRNVVLSSGCDLPPNVPLPNLQAWVAAARAVHEPRTESTGRQAGMIPAERIRAALSGLPVDRLPVMLHNFQPAIRRIGATQAQYRSDPAVMFRAHSESAAAFGLDGVLVDVDTALVAGACGAPADFPEDQPARIHGWRFETPAAIHGVPLPDLSTDPRIAVLVEGVRRLKQAHGDRLFIRGNCDQAPFSLAALVCRPEAFLMAVIDPEQTEDVAALLDWCSAVCDQMLGLMSASGCDMLSNGDSTAGPDVLSPRWFRRWVAPRHRALAERAHALGKTYLLHVCGNTTAILGDLVASGADALELDYKTDLAAIARVCPGKAALFGNIDPSGVLARGTPELVTAATRNLIQTYGTRSLVVGAGCALPPETPDANIRALVAAAHAGSGSGLGSMAQA